MTSSTRSVSVGAMFGWAGSEFNRPPAAVPPVFLVV
jgi:hypothetical protein